MTEEGRRHGRLKNGDGDGVTGAPLRTGNGSAIRHKISQGPAGNGAVGRRGFAGDLESLRPGKLFSACIGLLHKVTQVVLKRDRALQRVYFNAAGASRWPTDVLNPSFYEHEDPPLPVGYQLPPNPRNVQELFSGFPPRVGHGLVSGDGFQSADNTPASSDRLQQLGGGETDQGEKGSTTAESEASGPPSRRAARGAPIPVPACLSPTSSPRDVTVTPGLAAPITLPGPRLMARPYFGAETRASESPDRSPGRSPRPWPKDSLELLPQPAPQQPPSKPIVYTLSPHSTPSTASGSQKKHTIQIPGLVPSQKPSYSPSAPYKPGQSTGGIAPTPSAASLTTFGLQPQDTQASSQDPPYGHSIMQREKKQQGGREEAAEIRPSATRLPTAVGLRRLRRRRRRQSPPKSRPGGC